MRARPVGNRTNHPRTPPIERVLAKVERSDQGFGSPCWRFRGSLNRKGYGVVAVGCKSRQKFALVHRVTYAGLVGPIPEGLTIDHLCRVKDCCNPAHLEPVTIAENSRRAIRPKTLCIRGHELTPETTRTYRGARICKACDCIRHQNHNSRLQAHGGAV